MGPLAGAVIGEVVNFAGREIGRAFSDSMASNRDAQRAENILNHDYTSGTDPEPVNRGFMDNVDIGGMANNLYNAYSANNVNQQNKANTLQGQSFNSEEAAKNREFQREMSSTAYQRAVGDMTKAGFNPMLAFSQGGASSPGGSSASSPAYQGFVNPAASYASVRNVQADTANKETSNALIESQTAQSTASAANLEAQTKVAVYRLDEIDQHIKLMKSQALTEAERQTLMWAQARLAGAQKGLAEGNTTLAEAKTAVEQVREKMMRAELVGMENEAAMESTDFGQVSPYMRRFFWMLDKIFGRK